MGLSHDLTRDWPHPIHPVNHARDRCSFQKPQAHNPFKNIRQMIVLFPDAPAADNWQQTRRRPRPACMGACLRKGPGGQKGLTPNHDTLVQKRAKQKAG